MSFTAGLNNQPSKVFAVTESPAQLLLLPVARLQDWVKKYPQFNQLFLTQYNQRYSELIETMNHVLFEKMDKRILDYLKEKTVVTGKNSVKMTHREIATDLGTAREVVSRMLKKLESEQRIEVLDGVIKML
jgi:CRP/FNR family transcriptional regulator